MTQQDITYTILTAITNHICSLTYIEIPLGILWRELKKDVRERYGTYHDPKDLPQILSYIDHWSPSPDFVINLTFNKQEL